MDFMKIIVIEACGLHLGYLGCYGNDWVMTPNLDQLASEGVVGDWHFADQPDLTCATPWHDRSVATGNYALPGMPPIRSAALIAPRVVRCESLRSFASDVNRELAANDRWLWIEGPNLLPPWNLPEDLVDAYFDEEDIEDGLTPWTDPPLERAKLDDAEVLELQNTYASAVSYFDGQLGAVLEDLRESKQLDDVLLCVTARAGLPLGEHGMIGAPLPLLHDELVHVPLVMRLPHGRDGGLRISALTQPIDLLPTFMDALGEPILPMHGRSLWPLIRGEVGAIRPFAFAAVRSAGEEYWLMRSADYAFHLSASQANVESPRLPRLFLKPEDRWEVNDLYQQHVEDCDEMTETLQAFAAGLRPSQV
jgi:arylsulfatase A-like enzyme